MRKTRKTNKANKTMKSRKNKHLGTLKKMGGAVPQTQQIYKPQANETNKQYINRASQGVKTSLQGIQKTNGYSNPSIKQAASNAALYAQHVNLATNYITSNPQAKTALGAANVAKIQNLGDKLVQHTTNFQQSVANGDADAKINASLDAAKKTANAFYKASNDKDVQKHLASTGSTLYDMGSNMFDMGKKYSQGKLSYSDAALGAMKHGALGVKAIYHTNNAGLAAYKAANKPDGPK
jgi:hypothetical protein